MNTTCTEKLAARTIFTKNITLPFSLHRLINCGVPHARVDEYVQKKVDKLKKDKYKKWLFGINTNISLIGKKAEK